MDDGNMSIPMYNYLCCKLGNENAVKTRRLCYTISEYLYDYNSIIPSGSKAEGLDFKQSDTDIMCHLKFVHVHEHPPNYMLIDCFIISTVDTSPGYVRLISHGINSPLIRNWCIEHDKSRLLLSNKLLKEYLLSLFPYQAYIHGPCIADKDGLTDNAYCLRCRSWIQQANPWLKRKRTWPSPEMIDEIINFGVMLVPIGCKDSQNEDTEWRVSFSVAEKQLIYSFSHTQLLYYALMKILLTDVINLNQSCKDLLCSYFMKTVVFWASEELPVHVWKPENIISCFRDVMKRLLFFVKFENLPNYFISEMNIIKNRFDVVQLSNVVNLLTELYNRGIYCFYHSKTMSTFFHSNCFHWNFSTVSKIDHINSQIRIMFSNVFVRNNQLNNLGKLLRLLNRYKLKSHRFLYSTLTSIMCKRTSTQGACILEITNKNQYKRHKHYLPYLIIGLQSDALSGWLNLTTYFYCMKQYRLSSYLTVLILSKCHQNKILLFDHMLLDENLNNTLSKIEHEAIQLGKMNAFHICKRHLANAVLLSFDSCIYPLELHKEIRIRMSVVKSPIMYGMFLRFLCLYHLQDKSGVAYALQDLYDVRKYLTQDSYILDWNIFMGQAHYKLGNLRTAITYFKTVVELERLCTELRGDDRQLRYKEYAELMVNEIQQKL